MYGSKHESVNRSGVDALADDYSVDDWFLAFAVTDRDARTMFRPNLERMDLEFKLLIAQRRADQCSAYSPSWDAAMGLVDDLEAEIRRLDAVAHPVSQYST